MRLKKLFKVLVLGGTALAGAGCDDEAGDGQQRVRALEGEHDIVEIGGPDGVCAWLASPADAGMPDAGPPDAEPLPDGGVSGWLSWV